MLQGKGGVGKSFVSAVLAQYKLSKGQELVCIDTDPVNGTFSGYKKLNVKRLDIMEDEQINPRKFDELVEMIAGSDGKDIVVDNGAASFVPLSHYLIGHEITDLLNDMGHEVVIHTVVTGGQALLDTLNGFALLAQAFHEPALFVVWLNPYWGPVRHNSHRFEKLKAYTDNKDRVSSLIDIPDLQKETFGRDLSDMLQQRLTFDEALEDDTLTIMTRQRLSMIRKKMYQIMDCAAVL
jgi:CobQ/CobB/MinD/ParA nucleotide binding domain